MLVLDLNFINLCLIKHIFLSGDPLQSAGCPGQKHSQNQKFKSSKIMILEII